MSVPDSGFSRQERIERGEENLNRLLEWISRHDTKSAVVLGVATGMLGFLASSAPAPESWTVGSAAFSSMTVALLGVSLLFLHLGNYPRTEASSSSLLYFGTIARFSRDEYVSAFSSCSRDDYLRDLLAQSHEVSRILQHKFWALRWAYRLLFLALLPWTVSIYLLRIESG